MIPITASKVMEEEDLQHTVKLLLKNFILGYMVPSNVPNAAFGTVYWMDLVAVVWKN